MKRILTIRSRAIELTLLGLVALVVFGEGLRFVTTLSQSIGATEAGIYLLFLAGLLAFLSFLYGFQPQQAYPDDIKKDTADKDDRKIGTRNVLICMGLFFGFVLMLRYIDYAIATFIFFVAYLRIFGRYRWPVIILASAIVSIGSAYLWHVLGVTMPRRDFMF